MEKRRGLADDGMHRLQAMLNEADKRTLSAIVGQAALEREVELVLARVVPKPDRLRNLKHIHRIGVLRAIYADTYAQVVLDAIEAFADVRNSLAHGNSNAENRRQQERLRTTLIPLGDGSVPEIEQLDFGGVALVIVGALHVAFESGSKGAVRA